MPTGAAVLPVHGLDLRKGLRERVLQIALDNIYPPLVPDVHVIPIKNSATIADADRAVIVVRVLKVMMLHMPLRIEPRYICGSTTSLIDLREKLRSEKSNG